MTDTIVFKAVAYEDDAYIKYDRDGIVANHDELVKAGKAYYQIKALPNNEANRGHIADTHIIEPGDDVWEERFQYLQPGEYIRYYG